MMMLSELKLRLYWVKEDLKTVFTDRPVSRWAPDYTVNYTAYWEERRTSPVAPTLSRWQRMRLELLQSWIRSSWTVLDIGAGDGAFLAELKHRISCQVVGVDIDPVSVKTMQEQGIEAIRADLQDISAIQTLPKVDAVLALEILEHLPNAEQVLMTLLERAEQGVIFSVPNTGYFTYRLRLFFGRTPLQWVTHPGEHLRFWTRKDMRHWLASLGLVIKEERCYGGVPCLERLWPSLFGKGMIYSIDSK